MQVSTTRTSGQTGYDGTSDAWQLVRSSGGTLILNQALSLSGVYTFSCYVKINASNGFGIGFGSSNYALFNISDALQTSATLTIGLISSSITYVGDNFYRISVTANGTFSEVRFVNAIADGTSTTSAGGTHIVQDAQLEQGLVATDYIETTTAAVYTGITDNVPRLNYDGDCPSLLLEPQRTNLVTNSENIDDAASVVNSTVTTNESTSPDGSNSANKYTASASFPNIRFSVSVSNTVKYTFSCFVKYDGYRYQYIRFNTGFDASEPKVWFDLLNGVVATEQSGIDSSSIEDYGNGWYRITATSTATSTNATGQIRLHMTDTDNAETISGSTSLFNYIWGAQLEQGSYATSYIPTNGQTETRLKDVCYGGGDESTFNDSEGVLYAEVSWLGDTYSGLSLSDGTNSNRITITPSSSSEIRVVNAPSTFDFQNIDVSDITQNHKIAVKYSSSGSSVFVDGVLKDSDNISSSFSADTLNTIIFNRYDSSNNYLFGNVKALAYFPEALTDSELQTLTTI